MTLYSVVMKQILSKFIFTKILGWKLIGDFPKDLKKYVIIGAPHTSWMDFPIGILVKYALRVDVKFIGKKELFKPPFGFIFRWLGGTPVDRSKSTNLVDATVEQFKKQDNFIIALSPEGTREKVEKWKTGFYYIAKGANVPVVMFTLDFGNRQVAISKPYYTTTNKQEDFKYFYNFYKGVKGKKPELS